MLLKVEVYPFTGEAYSNGNDTDRRPPEETLHVCLATGDRDGRLLTVGRKTGDVMLGKDKSVSREHLILRMVTTNKTLSGDTAPPPARNDAEQEACQRSSFYQCTVVLESIGKLGSYLIEEVTPPTTQNNNNKKSAENGDDSDTDDEAGGGDAMMAQSGGVFGSQASQLPLSSWVRTLVLGDRARDTSLHIQSRLLPDRTILTELSSDNGQRRRLVLMCGKQESVLVVTRVPLCVQRTKSAFAGTTVPAWWSELYAAGAVDVSDRVPTGTVLLQDTTTHVISDVRSTTHRLLCAWLRSIPIVRAEYFRALLQRKSPSDPLPDVEEYEAPYPSKSSFWSQPPTPNVWKGLTYVSMKRDDDWPDVVRAMGGTVCRLYQEVQQQMGGDDSDDDDQDEEQMSQNRLAQFDPSCTWSVDWKVRRYVKPLKEAGIPIFSAKEVAKAVANSEVLPGLTPVDTTPQEPETTASAQPGEPQSTRTRQAVKSSAHNNALQSEGRKTCVNVPSAQVKDSSTPVKQEVEEKEAPDGKSPTGKPPAQDSDDDDEVAPKRSRASRSKSHLQDSKDEAPQPKRRKTRAKDDDDDDSDDESGPKRRAGRRSTQQRSAQDEETTQKDAKSSRHTRKEPEPMEVDETEDAPMAKEPKASKVAEKNDAVDAEAAAKSTTRNSSVEEEDGQQHDKLTERTTAKRVKLGNSTDKGGWLQAADPKKRKDHARTKDEMAEAYEGDGYELHTKAADTEWAPKPKNEALEVAPVSSRRRRAAYTGPNFKAFRKNSVPKLRIVDYQWKSHRSGTAVRQAQLEEEQRAADEQYRRANELFKDTAVSTNRRRKLR